MHGSCSFAPAVGEVTRLAIGPGNTTCKKFSDEAKLEIVVGHYPPGTSKWNKIEHRMFSFIGMNWKGEPENPRQTTVNQRGAKQ